MELFFSVVIPSYNRAGFIADVIRSFLVQDYQAFEILVVDDGSTDNTREVVQAINDSRVQYFHKINAERGAARNFGAARAKGKYITFFDSDDLVYPWYLSNAEENLNQLKFPQCFAQAFEFRKSVPEVPPVKNKKDDTVSTVNSVIQNENILACNGVFIRKDIFDRFKFSEDRNLSGSEDWFLWLQLSAVYPFYFSPLVCSCLIIHDQRGELNIDPSKLDKRLNALLKLMKTDSYLATHPNNSYKRILSTGHKFAALKMADFTRLKFKSIKNLLRAFMLKPSVITHRTTYVTIKKMLFSWHA